MLRLKNIVKKDNIISCDIISEDRKNACKMEYDTVKQDVILFELPAEYEYCVDDKVHARAFQ